MANLWQNGQKWFILGDLYKVQKTTLQSHDSYSTQKNAQIQTKYSKNGTLLKSGKIGHFAKAKSSKLTHLVAEFRGSKIIQKITLNTVT